MVAASAACAHRGGPSVHDVVKVPRTLTRDETARVLRAARMAIAGKHGRLISPADEAAGRPGTEFATGPDGRLQFLRSSGGIQAGIVSGDGTTATWTREVVTMTHLTGRAARACDGAPRAGQLVVVYWRDGGGWIATARSHVYPGSPTPLDDFLAGEIHIEQSDLQTIGARATRMFAATWTPPAAEAPAGTAPGPEYQSDDDGRTWTKARPTAAARLTQLLWIDTESLLPVRWAVMFAADPEHHVPTRPHTILSVQYDEARDLRPPSGVSPPDCVP